MIFRMEAGTRMIGLVRVSSVEQGRSGLGLEAQESAIRGECDRRGWHLADIVIEAAVSGRSKERKGLNEVLNRIGNGEVQGVVVAKLDRLSRSVVDFGRILAWLDAAGGYLVALDLGVDTSQPGGRLVANVLASVAEWEADTISARTTAALAAKRQRGEQVGRTPVPQAVAQRIRAMRHDEQMTYQAICDRLNAEGVPTARGAAAWSVSAVQSSLGYQRPKRAKAADLPALPKRRRSVVG
jgi:DNA invertase Pin-like site-specific DNA recombinase